MAMRDAWIEKRATAMNGGVRNVSQMHYARQGVITEEMQYVAKREKLDARTGAQRSRPRPRHHPRQYPSPQSSSPWASASPSAARSTPTSAIPPSPPNIDEELEEAASRRALRRRHRHGPFHRRRHPHDSQSHHRRLARARRHRADLRSDLPRHAAPKISPFRSHAGSDRRTSRAGRGLHDHSRRRSARICAARPQSHHRNRQPRRRAHGAVDELPQRSKISSTKISTTSARSSRSTTSAFRSAMACAPAASPTPATKRNSPN